MRTYITDRTLNVKRQVTDLLPELGALPLCLLLYGDGVALEPLSAHLRAHLPQHLLLPALLVLPMSETQQSDYKLVIGAPPHVYTFKKKAHLEPCALLSN